MKFKKFIPASLLLIAVSIATNVQAFDIPRNSAHLLKHRNTPLSAEHKLSHTGMDSIIAPNIILPDWSSDNVHLEGYNPGYYGGSLGDINGDGFEDAYFNINRSWPNVDYKTLIYYGHSTGLSPTPDYIFSLRDTLDMSSLALHPAGDVNGDGYDDIILYGLSIRPSEFEYPMMIFGSPAGINNTAVQVPIDVRHESGPYAPLITYPAGDLNADGYEDLIFVNDYPHKGYVAYGSATGLNTTVSWPQAPYEDPSWLVMTPFVYSSDFNNDGYDDVAYSSDRLYIFYGSATGITTTAQQKITLYGGRYVTYWEPMIITGDFNGDSYDDVIAHAIIGFDENTEFLYERAVIFMVPGSPSGLDTVNHFIIQDENYGGVTSPKFWGLGDINNDGFDDFSYEKTIYYGGKLSQADYTWNQFHGVDFNHNGPRTLRRIGDVDGNGSDDIMVRGERWEVYLSDEYEPVSLNCAPLYSECFYGPNHHYSIDLPELSNSLFKYNQYTVRHPLNIGNRNGPGLDASGKLEDNSLIIYSVQGFNNQSLSCTTQVKINTLPITNVSIKPNYAHPKGDPYTFYIGYGETAFRLAALPAGGGGPYTYRWSNGSTEKNPRISESVPGEYPYWVKMKNVHGCETSDTAIIKVENALCSSPLVDVVMSQYPAILQNPLLANLIKSNSKIAVCKDGQTMCFTKAVVDIRISRAGYTIGACTPGVIPAEAFMTDEMEDILRGGLKVIVAPNPSSHAFQLNVVSIYNEPVMIRIMDLAGRQVEVLNNASSNQTITIGHKLRAGTYIAEVISGKEREVVKLVKMQ